MFICKNCKTADRFELMFAPDYQGEKRFQMEYNEKGELEITVDGYKFIPDLQFMNTHAVCGYCGQIYMWDYNMKGGQNEKIQKK